MLFHMRAQLLLSYGRHASIAILRTFEVSLRLAIWILRNCTRSSWSAPISPISSD